MERTNEKKKGILGTGSATVICFLVAALVIVVGYIILSKFRQYTLLDFVDSIVGNLIGVFGGFCVFDILYNRLTQEAQTRETSQQIAKTLMGEPEILEAFCEEDKKRFIKSTVASLVYDCDVVDMLTMNLEKYVNMTGGARIRKVFDYNITLEPELPQQYIDMGFPGVDQEMHYLLEEELFFKVKCLAEKDEYLKDEIVSIGFSYDKKSMDEGILETPVDSDFSKCIFNEELVISEEAIEFFNNFSENELKEVLDKLFAPILRIDNSLNDDQYSIDSVIKKENGFIIKFKLEYNTEVDEHEVRIIFNMPRLWDSIVEVTLVDPTKDPHIKLKFKPSKMNVEMYSYLNKETQANTGAYITRAGMFDIAIKNEWIYPKSGVVFNIKRNR